jgi:Secretion system C-terminal sorting domain
MISNHKFAKQFLLTFAVVFAILVQVNGQQLTVTMGNAKNQTATSFEFDILVANTSTSTIKLGNYQPQIFQMAPGTAIPTGTAPTYALVEEGPTYSALNTPNTLYNNSTFRITQTVVAAGSAVSMPSTTPNVVATVKITSNAGPITYPVTLQFRTSTPNTTVLGYVGTSTTTTSFSLANGNLVNGAPLVVAAPLPVTLISFTAAAQGALNLIKWVTASERNTAFHVVERSQNGVDSWEQVAKVTAAGTTSEEQKYSAEDKRPYAKTYYRLRTTDYDGSEERSHIVSVVRKASGEFGITAVYPSPTSDAVSVQFEVAEEATATIQVFDFTGRMVLEQQLAAAKGTNTQAVNLTTLAAGVYSVQVRTETEISAQVKVVKQ